MATRILGRIIKPLSLLALVWVFSEAGAQSVGGSGAAALLTQIPGWTLSGAAERYLPETLYEYIDGAAEAYLGYDFKEAAVGQFRSASSKAAVTAEVYDMGTTLNAFGIYSAERYPDGRFLSLGLQGYIDGESLNVLAGRYYLKLMCYDAGEKAEAVLTLFAKEIAGKVKDKGQWPEILAVFPKDGIVPNSEKFILRNVLGFKFLSNGFAASYKRDGQEFEGILIQAKTPVEAGGAVAELAAQFAKNGQTVENNSSGLHVRDAYLKNVFLAQSGSLVCVVTKVKDGYEAAGERLLTAMVKALAGRNT